MKYFSNLTLGGYTSHQNTWTTKLVLSDRCQYVAQGKECIPMRRIGFAFQQRVGICRTLSENKIFIQ